MKVAAHPLAQIDCIHHRHGEVVSTVDIGDQAPLFQGHYPGLAIVPGVLIIDIVASIAAALTGAEQWGISSVRFRELVVPPAQLSIRVTTEGDGMVRATCSNGPSPVASMSLRQVGP